MFLPLDKLDGDENWCRKNFIMFTAYGNIHYSLYSVYEKYALLAPGSVEAAYLARYMLSHTDVEAKEFNETFRAACASNTYGIVQEYRVFCVRAADGMTFDIYLVDEDQLFMASSAGVESANVISEGMKLMENWRNFSPVSFHPSEEDTRFSIPNF